jgi:hypothetical protein
MNAADAVRLLGYVAPLVRFLGARRLRGLAFDPPGLRPLPDGLRDLLAAAGERLLPGQPAAPAVPPAGADDEGGAAVTLYVGAEGEPAWCLVREGQDAEARRQALPPPPDQPCPEPTGLAEHLAGAWYAPLGTLVLADWLEDRSGPSALATALRASEPEPVLNYDYGTVRYDAFRWRWLEPGVVCYFSRCTADWPSRQRRYVVGHVLGLLRRSPDGQVRRWARWVRDGEAAGQLAASMGVELPEKAEAAVW